MNPDPGNSLNNSATALMPLATLVAYPFRLFLRRIRMELFALQHPNRFLTQPALIQRLNNLRNGRTRCHIVCSGYSAPSTVAQIETDDFVLGFGYAALLDLTFDAYFFEVAATGNSWDRLVTRVFARFYNQILRHRTKELFFKNYWNGRIDIECLAACFDPVPLIAMDIHAPAHKSYTLAELNRLVCKSLLNAKSRSLSQAGGSVMTLISLAIKAGAKEIVLHGLDLSGPHFYATRNWEVPEFLLAAGFRGIYPVQDDYEHPHLTKTATNILIPLLEKSLPGVEIRNAIKTCSRP